MPAATTHESVDPTRPPHEADVAGELLTPPLEQKIGQQTIDTHALDAALTAEHINAITVKAPSIVDQYRYFSKANTAKQSKARSSYYGGFIEPLEQLIDTYYSTGKAYGEMCSDFEKYLPKKNVEFMNLVKIEVQGILMRNAVAAYCAANELSFALPSQDQIMLGANAVVNGNALRVYIGTDKKRGVIPQYQLYVDSRGLEELHVYPDMIRDSSIAFLLTSINAKRTQKTPAVSQKHTVPHKVKGHVVDIHQDPHARTTPIIASMPTHTVGLVENYQESPYKYPDDIVNTDPEQILSMIINDALEGKLIDGYKLTREDAQKLIIGSIDIDDPGYVTTLKRLAAYACGAKLRMSPLAMVKQLSGHIRTSGLRDFLVYAYEWSHPEAPGSQTFTDTIMDSISGFRVEASVAKLARAAGYEVREATRKEDAMGADLFIDGLPFDCKASQKGATKHAREEHRKRSSSPNRFRSILLVPPITEKDFAGELVISDQTAGRLVETTNFREMIDNAVAKYLDMPQ